MSQWVFSHFLLSFLTFFSPIYLPITVADHPRPQFPCKAPHFSSYPFCNTSLPISTRVQSLISLLTLDEKILQLSNGAAAVSRLGIPAYEWWSESLHGIATNGPGVSFNGTVPAATSFPQVILTAAAFNRSLWFSIAAAIGVEARAMYNVGQAGLTFWAPNINIFRDPRWGRGQETPGEDPATTAAYAVEYVRAFQGESRTERDGGTREKGASNGPLMLSACCKHFTAYDLENWGGFSRYSFNAKVSKQDLEDTYQPPFRSCIEEGHASCLMCSYNQVNGVPTCARRDLFQQARDEWGFKGYITSDCDAVAVIYENQDYASSPEDAVADVLNAGMDINCGTYLVRHTLSALKQGKVQEDDINRALFNLFSVQLRLGHFDGNPTKKQFRKLGPKDICTKEHRELALEAARQGIVLLKNENKFLPLKKETISSLAIIGPAANDTSKLGGGYTGIPCNPESLLKGHQAYIEKIHYATGCPNITCDSDTGFKEAVHMASKADVVVAVVGLDLSQETEDHDRTSLLLPGKQMDLVSNIARVSKRPLILILMGGGPLDVSFAKEDPQIASILWVGYPGEMGGRAVADVIFGKVNPGGRLPMTWYPESFTQVPMNDMSMRVDPSRGYPGRTYRFYTGKVVYGFGHGLSYSDFSYKFLSVPEKISLSRSFVEVGTNNSSVYERKDGLDYINVSEVESCDALKFHIQISVLNSGDMDGSHVIMLFSRAATKIRGAPQKQLIGFERIHTVSYRTTEFSILVNPCKHFSTVNDLGIRIMPLGAHIFMLDDVEHPIFVTS